MTYLHLHRAPVNTYNSTSGALCVCSLYEDTYLCMNDWLLNQFNCSSDVLPAVIDVVRRFILPFGTDYHCTTTVTPSPTGSSSYLLVPLMAMIVMLSVG